jgi:hypothetical protein
MSKGLKQMVAEATEAQPEAPAPDPVQVSDEAMRALSVKMREWSGWPDSHVAFGDPSKYGSPFAACDHTTHRFTANPDRLVLNPNRVLLTVTPFRLRQEAVLTGALLHEAGHARHSRWLPRTKEEADAKPLLHSDGTEPTRQTVALARLMEEPRVESLMAAEADRIGASGLGWTMRASAAHLVPMTALSTDPNQRIMDLITSWALRAGRQIALQSVTGLTLRNWVQDFTTLLHDAIRMHLSNTSAADPATDTRAILTLLVSMTQVTDDTGPTMIDSAREVLTLLFPETEEGNQPEAGSGCTAGSGSSPESESGEGGEGSEQGEQGEGDTEPEDEGSGTDPGAGDSGEEAEAEPGEAEPEQEGGGDGEPESEPEPEPEPEPDEDASASTESVTEADTESELAKALADMEQRARDETTEDAEEDAEGAGAGGGSGTHLSDGWRVPNKAEREVAKNAERFLRNLLSPSETLRRTLDDSPSAMVNGAAMAAWKAGGQVNAPRFFVRSRRNVEPSPPVKIAVLVDVSSSMEELQTPSAILSWALASAALDMRNFAGRGQQIESTLIHWGGTARVIQKNGQPLPGIREFGCYEGTYAMSEALDLVAQELPGFFDETEHPTNRLLMQFTDWELFGRGTVVGQIKRALEVGVNMVTVAPHDYSDRRADLNNILAQCPIKRGSTTLIRYNPMFPDQVWDAAAKALS